MTWKELKDKISLMTEEEQQQEVAVWGEDISLRNKDCSLEKTNEALYYDPKWDYALEEANWSQKTRIILMYIRYVKQECIIFQFKK